MDPATETKYCSNCKRDIASVNYVMHEVHCKRNIVLCKHCQEPVPRNEVENHFEENHAKVKCTQCREDVEKSEIDDHQENSCKKRSIECPYCELSFAFDETTTHQDQCGSRTDKCATCDQYIMLKDMIKHENSGCTYPTQIVKKQNPTQNQTTRIYTDEFPADFSSSFVRNEMGRILNPAGTYPYNEGFSSEGIASLASVRPPPPSLNLKDTNKKKGIVTKKKSNVSSPGASSKVLPNKSSSTAGQRNNVVNPPSRRLPPSYSRPVQAESDETDMLARHLLQDLSSLDEPMDYQAGINEDTVIPCEFCGAQFQPEDLILHESGCNPEEAHKPVKYNHKPNNMGPPSPSRTAQPNVVNNRGIFNDWNPSYQDDYEAFPSSVTYTDGADDYIELPCEFCGSVFPMLSLLSHQVQCELNPTATPRNMTPAVPQMEDTEVKVFARSNRRQMYPEFASDLGTRLESLQVQDEDESSFGIFTNSTNNRGTDASTRRKNSSTKRKELLEDLIHNPTGSKNTGAGARYGGLPTAGSGDGSMGFDTDYVVGGNRKPAAKPVKPPGAISRGGAGSSLRSNGYEASFSPSSQNGNSQRRSSKPSSQVQGAEASTGSDNVRKTKKSYTRTRKL